MNHDPHLASSRDGVFTFRLNGKVFHSMVPLRAGKAQETMNAPKFTFLILTNKLRRVVEDNQILTGHRLKRSSHTCMRTSTEPVTRLDSACLDRAGNERHA